MLLLIKNKNRLKQVRIVVEKVLICLCIEVNTVRNNSVLIFYSKIMSKKLWEASLRQKKKSFLYKYERFISEKFNKRFNRNYENILKWSINSPGNFWSSIWDFSEIKGFKSKLKI